MIFYKKKYANDKESIWAFASELGIGKFEFKKLKAKSFLLVILFKHFNLFDLVLNSIFWNVNQLEKKRSSVFVIAAFGIIFLEEEETDTFLENLVAAKKWQNFTFW